MTGGRTTTEETECFTEHDKASRNSVETWYSWVVLFVGLTCHIVYFGLTWCVGVYYIIFLEVFSAGSGPTSWIGSINTASMYYIAPVGGVLIGRFTCRALIMTGSVLSALGLFACFYANSIYYLYLTFGLLAGGGIGLGFIPIITLTSRYFDRHRALAMGLCTSGIGVTLLLMPVVIDAVREAVGWRGSLVIFSGLMVQTVAFAALAKPIHIPDDGNDDDFDTNESHDEQFFLHKLQLDIFMNKRYLVLCVSDTAVLFGWSVILVHLAAYAQTNGVEPSWTYGALGIGQLLGRLFFGALGQWPRNDFVMVFIAAILLSGTCIVSLPSASSVTGILVIVTLHAFLQGVCGPYVPQLVIEFQGLHKLAPAYGYLLLFEGTGILLGAPVAGSLFDSTRVYDYSFYLGGGTLVLAACLMLPARLCLTSRPRTLAEIARARSSMAQSYDAVIAGSLAKLASSRLDIYSNNHRSNEHVYKSTELRHRSTPAVTCGDTNDLEPHSRSPLA